MIFKTFQTENVLQRCSTCLSVELKLKYMSLRIEFLLKTHNSRAHYLEKT